MRTEDDQWGITESVGATALGVASGRAMESARADGLVDDPYAAAFVDAASPELALPTSPDADPALAEMSTYVGVRSRFFDRYLLDAAGAGIGQVVLLAAGLDTRAQRLAWPAGTTVFEVDQSGVLGFKDRVLDEVDGHAGTDGTDGTDGSGTSGGPGAPGAARRVTVEVDLRHDWPAALRAAGFDPARPTVWLAEGLLPYLPATAEADLFDRVSALSATGSRIAVEHFGASIAAMTDDEHFHAMSERFGVDVRDLFPADGERTDPSERLDGLGWDVVASPVADLAREYGRPLDPTQETVFGPVSLLGARRR